MKELLLVPSLPRWHPFIYLTLKFHVSLKLEIKEYLRYLFLEENYRKLVEDRLKHTILWYDDLTSIIMMILVQWKF